MDCGRGAAPWSSLESKRENTETSWNEHDREWSRFTLDDLVKTMEPCAGNKEKEIKKYNDYSEFPNGAIISVAPQWDCNLDFGNGVCIHFLFINGSSWFMDHHGSIDRM